tara:strand:- start:537 stop:806 length:270 start_codon:yes stop_codon:yes gene_type:complete
MAKTIDSKFLQTERESLETQLVNANATVEKSKNTVQALMGAIAMTDRLIAVFNSEGVPEGNAAEAQKSLEEHAKDMVSEIGDDDLGKVE